MGQLTSMDAKATTVILTPKCHKMGNSLVWSGKGVHLWGSGVSHGILPLANGIHINLGPQEYGVMSKYYTDPSNILNLPKQKTMQHEVLISWDDFGAPALEPSFWRMLAKRLLEAKLPILVFCWGGHGRTGTALAILLGLWGVSQPMSYVRSHYCENAGESVEQIKYLDNVLTKCGLSGQVSKRTYEETGWYTGDYIAVGALGQDYGYSYGALATGTGLSTYKPPVVDPMPKASVYKSKEDEVRAAIEANAKEDAWWEERYGREYIECSDGVWRRRDQMTQAEIEETQHNA